VFDLGNEMFNKKLTIRNGCCGLILVATAMAGFSAEAADEFYSGKTIQMIVSSGPGVATDTVARLVVRFLGKHVPGNPSIVARNMPGGGGLVAANYTYSVAKPDGLTILAVSRANYLEQLAGRPEVQADFRKFSWLGSFNKSPMMMACRSDSPYKTLAAPPGLPPERLQILRESLLRVWRDAEFAAEAKKLTDWDGSWHLTGAELQKRHEAALNQPADVVRRIKEILQES